MRGSIRLRSAKPTDEKVLLKWRNDPFIVRLGALQKTVTPEEHHRWFVETLSNVRKRLFIVVSLSRPIGQVRFDQISEDKAEVSIYLLKPYTGKGLGVLALRSACETYWKNSKVLSIAARVRQTNAHSVSAFRKAGFTLQAQAMPESDDTLIELSLERPAQIPHNRCRFDSADVKAVKDVLLSGRIANGPQVETLEKLMREKIGYRNAVCVGSGSAALRLALKALKVKEGDEVLVPAYSCVALANAVLSTGATPKIVDVSADTWNVNQSSIRKHISPRTSAIILVNTFGIPAYQDELSQLKIPIIEDASHGFMPASSSNAAKPRAAIWLSSFYATKFLGGGEGGIVLTNDDVWAGLVRSWRFYDEQPKDASRFNDKMTDIEATLVINQLQKLTKTCDERHRAAMRYDRLLRLESLQYLFKRPAPTTQRVWYRYSVQLTTLAAQDVIRLMHREGIRAESPVTDWRTSEEPFCPSADNAYKSLISLPLFPGITVKEQATVCQAFKKALQELTHG